jgi:hypothetical protein
MIEERRLITWLPIDRAADGLFNRQPSIINLQLTDLTHKRALG